MKRFLSFLLLLCLLLPSAALAAPLPTYVEMRPGESRAFSLPFAGYWESDAEEVATGEGDCLVAHAEGSAVVALVSFDGEQGALVQVVVRQMPSTGGQETPAYDVPADDKPEEPVPEDAVPPVIRQAIAVALHEWEALGEKRLPQDPKGNKFTKWWKYACGWCGAFVSYCLDTAGVPLEPTDTYRKVKPHADGVPYGIREAAVPKLYTGFENMQRLTDVPRPGYLIIYGAKGYYDFVHVGMVTDVIDCGNGVYQVFTVEGNVSSTVKRYSFLYDSTAKREKNLMNLPQDEWTEPKTYHYDEARRTSKDGKAYPWFIMTFCQTWY